MDPKALTRHLRRVEPLSAIVVVVLLLLRLSFSLLFSSSPLPTPLPPFTLLPWRRGRSPSPFGKLPDRGCIMPIPCQHGMGKILDIKRFEGNVCIFSSWQDYLCNSSFAAALPIKSNGYIRIDCYGGLNQMRRDLCDGIGIACLLIATMVLPKFEVAAYWNESRSISNFADVLIYQKKLHQKSHLKWTVQAKKASLTSVEAVLPVLFEHHYVSITPTMCQRRDRYLLHAKASVCRGCYDALHLNRALEAKGSELVKAIPEPFLSLHLRFEPDMVAYSQRLYEGLSSASLAAIEAARGDRKSWTGDAARVRRNRGKCPLTPNEMAFILHAFGISPSTTICLAAGDGLVEIEGFISVYTNVYTKSSLLSNEDFDRMHRNTKAALDYYVSMHTDAYVATYFGNMDKMVTAMRTLTIL
uniref:O-fucosyltransferase family protein n=1 Tax=Ananas comosus var. bracteatus TaxID=296719 RepID=A0A6V7Q9I3_ANACO|nr:unnamed protein product [Ananas comosus var. bracteatus]